MQTLKRTCQEANKGLALYTLPCNFVTMVTTAYYVHCPLSLPSAFNNCTQQNTSFFVYGLLQRVIQWMYEEVWRNVRPRLEYWCRFKVFVSDHFNILKPNDIYIYIYIYIYICRTAALTSRRYILNIYSTNIHTEYFKHAA